MSVDHHREQNKNISRAGQGRILFAHASQAEELIMRILGKPNGSGLILIEGVEAGSRHVPRRGLDGQVLQRQH